MASLSNKYIVVEKFVPPKKEGEFEVAQVMGDEVYKGIIVELPEIPVYLGNRQLVIGDLVIFAPHSPDTFTIEKQKFVRSEDLLKCL